MRWLRRLYYRFILRTPRKTYDYDIDVDGGFTDEWRRRLP